ncbi:restriction endonuclease [Oryzomonas sagensis]|nr:restriction endonuclease [Oryzomonas sagensis]
MTTIVFNQTVHPINFSDLSGNEFERLVFATLLRMYAWHTLDWYGQTGGDKGRDIIGTRDDEYGNKVTVVVACANWKNFAVAKGNSDIDKIVKGLPEPPHEVIIIAGNDVSGATKEKCRKHAEAKGVSVTTVWSGSEFEERLRFHAASVLERFFKGETLPDESKALQTSVLQLDPSTEREAGELVALLFKRPAFSTPIFSESSLPAFHQAISDTIGALNTGIWRDREGAMIYRIPSRQSFPSTSVRESLGNCVDALNLLRISFDDGIRTGKIHPCGCDKADCPTFMIEHRYCEILERHRAEALQFANKAFTELGVDQV